MDIHQYLKYTRPFYRIIQAPRFHKFYTSILEQAGYGDVEYVEVYSSEYETEIVELGEKTYFVFDLNLYYSFINMIYGILNFDLEESSKFLTVDFNNFLFFKSLKYRKKELSSYLLENFNYEFESFSRKASHIDDDPVYKFLNDCFLVFLLIHEVGHLKVNEDSLARFDEILLKWDTELSYLKPAIDIAKKIKQINSSYILADGTVMYVNPYVLRALRKEVVIRNLSKEDLIKIRKSVIQTKNSKEELFCDFEGLKDVYSYMYQFYNEYSNTWIGSHILFFSNIYSEWNSAMKLINKSLKNYTSNNNFSDIIANEENAIRGSIRTDLIMFIQYGYSYHYSKEFNLSEGLELVKEYEHCLSKIGTTSLIYLTSLKKLPQNLKFVESDNSINQTLEKFRKMYSLHNE